jgi:hypothetical protein
MRGETAGRIPALEHIRRLKRQRRPKPVDLQRSLALPPTTLGQLTSRMRGMSAVPAQSTDSSLTLSNPLQGDQP